MKKLDIGILFVPIVPRPPFTRPLPSWAEERLWRVACLHAVGLQALLPTPANLRDQRVVAYRAAGHAPRWHIPLAAFLSLPAEWLIRNFHRLQGPEVVVTIPVGGLDVEYPHALFQAEEIEGANSVEYGGGTAWWWKWW